MHHLGSASFYELLIVKDVSYIFAKLDLDDYNPTSGYHNYPGLQKSKTRVRAAED